MRSFRECSEVLGGGVNARGKGGLFSFFKLGGGHHEVTKEPSSR